LKSTFSVVFDSVLRMKVIECPKYIGHDLRHTVRVTYLPGNFGVGKGGGLVFEK